ncbi:MAG: hypothetical protein ACYTG4_00540 [Planctomycetota bacterium]|jgi:hypothetical protein
MIVPEKVSLSDFVSRRLNPMKVAMAYLRHELSVNSTGERTNIDRHELASVIATMELFVEDYEKLVTREPRSTTAPVSADRGYVPDARS